GKAVHSIARASGGLTVRKVQGYQPPDIETGGVIRMTAMAERIGGMIRGQDNLRAEPRADGESSGHWKGSEESAGCLAEYRPECGDHRGLRLVGDGCRGRDQV